jgi:protein tyrosine phosphatase (PTP) superfamily phosphohydrolase (DUF442 family)
MNRLSIALVFMFGCTNSQPPSPSIGGRHELKKIEAKGCENVIQVTPRIISGSEPHGEEGFRALARLGVRTIISVDGAKPDHELAAKYGIRYVHLPIGYDGVPKDRALEMARAVRDLPGPVYMHCHHGKHRGPGAAGMVLVAIEGWSNDDAVEFLKTAGVSKDYPGLYKDVSNFKAATAAELDTASSEFPPVAKLPDLARAMADIDRRWDNLKYSKDAGWKTPKDHPDIDPPHEAMQLLELFTELNRSDDVKKRPDFFRRCMNESEAAAKELRSAIQSKQLEKADQLFGQLKMLCASCHNEYRNKPK